MDTMKMIAVVIAALLVIVTPAYAPAQQPAVQTVVIQPGQQLLSQKSKPGLLESVGCSNDDFSSVYNHPDNRGKIGITCGGFDSNEAIGEPTTNRGGKSFHYNKAVSCRNWVVEVRPNSVLTIPADCKPRMGQKITELQAVNEALKAREASANGRADEAARRADDNLGALERVSAMYHGVANDLTRRIANLTFLTVVSFAFSAAGIVFIGLVIIRMLKRLKELDTKVSSTPDPKVLIEEFRKGVIPAMSKDLESAIEIARREGHENGERRWAVKNKELNDARATLEAEAARDREKRLLTLAQINAKEEATEIRSKELDARENHLAAREAEIARAVSVMIATMDDRPMVGSETSPPPLAEANGYPTVGSRGVNEVRIATATIPIGADPEQPPVASQMTIPKPSGLPDFTDDSRSRAAPDEQPDPEDEEISDCTTFEIVKPTFTLSDDGTTIICNICGDAIDVTQGQHDHFMCNVCTDSGVMDEIGLNVHINDRHPELMTSHSDRPKDSGHRVLPPKFEPVEDSNLQECGYCFDCIETDEVGGHVHVECTRCVPPKILFVSEIGTHETEMHLGDKKGT